MKNEYSDNSGTPINGLGLYLPVIIEKCLENTSDTLAPIYRQFWVMNMIDVTLNRYRIYFFYIFDIYFHVFSCIFNIGEYIWTAIMGNSNDFDVF